jgi:hypothetical protein
VLYTIGAMSGSIVGRRRCASRRCYAPPDGRGHASGWSPSTARPPSTGTVAPLTNAVGGVPSALATIVPAAAAALRTREPRLEVATPGLGADGLRRALYALLPVAGAHPRAGALAAALRAAATSEG